MDEIWDNIYQISLSLEKYLQFCLTLFKPYENKEYKKGVGFGSGHGRDTAFLHQIVSMWKH
jgi:hypothetical protein